MYDILGNLKKGLTQLVVLKLLSESDELYGFQIIHAVEECGSKAFRLTEGALYPTLHRMEQKGLVSSRKEESGARILRRFYSITQKGRDLYRSDIKKYKALSEDMSRLLELK